MFPHVPTQQPERASASQGVLPLSLDPPVASHIPRRKFLTLGHERFHARPPLPVCSSLLLPLIHSLSPTRTYSSQDMPSTLGACALAVPSTQNAFPPLTNMACPFFSSATSSEKLSMAALSYITLLSFLPIPLLCVMFLHGTYHRLTNVYGFVSFLLLLSH